jgi:aspartate racemase
MEWESLRSESSGSRQSAPDILDRPARIGLLGGIGPASTALYYDLLVAAGKKRGVAPDLVVYSMDFDHFTWLEDHDRSGYVQEIQRGLEVLRASGARVLAMAANSPHAVVGDLVLHPNRPLVDIVESVASAAQEVGVRRALLLGIPATMTRNFYSAALDRVGVRVEVPDSLHYPRIRRIVFDELTFGTRSASSREWLMRVVAEHTVDALILGCTELSLLIGPRDAPVRVLDSTRLHVEAILDAAYTPGTNGT